jgi:hypothetical protein
MLFVIFFLFFADFKGKGEDVSRYYHVKYNGFIPAGRVYSSLQVATE